MTPLVFSPSSNERSLIHIPHQYYIPDVLFLQGIQLDWNSRLNPVADKIA